MMTFDDYKQRVSIIQVAEDLGYKFDERKGKITPTYKLSDSQGNKIDEIIIKNPLNPSQQHYYDRNYKGGDLISFIKNHINDFPQFSHKNEYVKLNQILGHYANIPYVPKFEPGERFAQKKEFDNTRYTSLKAELKDLSFLTKERNLKPETVNQFLPFILKVKDNQSKYNYANIAFPYTVPGMGKISNYELRNYGFKGMAAGGDKTSSVWIATKAHNPNLVKNLYFFESAIDAMSFQQLNNINLNDSALISVGGYVTKKQINNTIKHFPQANINTCFDNDINGKLYDIVTYSTAIGKDIKVSKTGDNYTFKWDDKAVKMDSSEISLNKFRDRSGLKQKFGNVHKPPGSFNDWNEILKNTSQDLNKGIKL